MPCLYKLASGPMSRLWEVPMGDPKRLDADHEPTLEELATALLAAKSPHTD